jgi:hypothetical protein
MVMARKTTSARRRGDLLARDNKSEFARGWVDGWKAICGPHAAMPTPPDIIVPSGFDPYDYGYEHGRAVAGGK